MIGEYTELAAAQTKLAFQAFFLVEFHHIFRHWPLMHRVQLKSSAGRIAVFDVAVADIFCLGGMDQSQTIRSFEQIDRFCQ